MAQARSSLAVDLAAQRQGLVGGRNAVPEIYMDMANWPGYDDSKLTGAAKDRFRCLRDATALYLQGRPMKEVLVVAKLGQRRFLRIFSRAFELDGEGHILGCAAFAKGAHIAAPRRTRLNPPSTDGKGGYYGAFRLLLRDHPAIQSKLITYLNGFGLKGLRPNRVLFRQIRRKFEQFCVEEGLGARDYPLKTRDKGRRPLRSWIDTDYMPMYARRFARSEHGKDASDLLAYGEGDGTADREFGGYGAWIIDATAIDVEARYEIPSPKGDWQSLELRKFQQLRLIHKGTSANLASRQVYAAQVSGHDVATLLWDAINGPPAVPTPIPGMQAEEGAGYPANVIPELRFAVPTVVYLDNALAHLADDVQHIVGHLFGCKVNLGMPKTPHERAHIESKFSLQARRVVHQVPSTTGTGPRDPMRKTHSVKVESRVRAEELEQVLDVYVRNENALPASGAHNVAPLERLRRLLAAGAIKPNYLPPDKRKAYFFGKPYKVTVHVDTGSGRRAYINYMYQRYSSKELGNRFDLKSRTMYVRADLRNIRTVMLFDDRGREFGIVQVLGDWGAFPHDIRIRRIYGSLKREGELGSRADDRPLEALFDHLRRKAPRDTTAALRLTYLLSYLLRNDYEMEVEMRQEVANLRLLEDQARAIAILPITDVGAPTPPRLGGPAKVEPANLASEVQFTEKPSLAAEQRWVLAKRPRRVA